MEEGSQLGEDAPDSRLTVDQLEPIAVPTLFVCGTDDGCALPLLADGQDRLLSADYRAERWEATGHFPHLEHPTRTAEAVLEWFRGHGLQARAGSGTTS